MNHLIVTFISLLLYLPSISQNYTPADNGSKVHFSIKNFGVNTGGDFSHLRGQIDFNPQNLAVSSFSVTVDVSTVDTDSETRDGHLRGENYFDAEKFPVISIKSTKISATNKSGVYNFAGLLTMHGVTKEFFFPFTATPQGGDYVFAGEFELNRLEYSVGESSAVMSKTVKVSLSVLAKKS
ncbi:MAG: YceI family protein [Ginsengibacter sp.]